MTLDEFIRRFVTEDTLIWIWSMKNMDSDTYSARKIYYAGSDSLDDSKSYQGIKLRQLLSVTSQNNMLSIQIEYVERSK